MKVETVITEDNRTRYMLVDVEGEPVIPVMKYIKFKDDVWNVDNPFFNELKPDTWKTKKIINFSELQEGVKEEVKFFFAKQLSEEKLSLQQKEELQKLRGKIYDSFT